ncbi:MAG: Nif3-like dinuclear metal center hexameric protein, partial [Slackia sp.]|nr:Nif3-like dinuclear metal center hexameric protein [Slackia sp.]
SLIAPRESGAAASGAVVYEAARRGIALVNYHTALDVSVAAQTVLPRLLSLERVGVLDLLDCDGALGYGQVCVVSGESPTLEELALRCTAVFGRPPRVWGDAAACVSSVATWTGSAGDAPRLCLERGIDVLVCGEVKYHTALDAAAAGLAIIELGHDVSELPFSAVLAEACAAAGVSRESITCLAQQGNWFHPESRRV